VGAASSFLRHADRLWSARRIGDPGEFSALVARVLAQVQAVDGRAIVDTPLVRADALAAAFGFDGELWVKNDTVNVAGSHKVRHLIGLALHVLAAEQHDARPLAIASCGNAALAAAVVAKAIGRELHVFIPTNANRVVVDRLQALGAHITVCARQPREVGDPCFLRFEEVIRANAMVPFCCQGSVAPDTFDGGRTLAWEIVDQLVAHDGGAPVTIDHVVVQVGGGALAASVHLGMVDAVEHGLLRSVPALDVVQTTAAAPLDRAIRLLRARAAEVGPDDSLAQATRHGDQFMWAWEHEPVSVATGILDDLTHDWLPVAEAMLRTGGHSVVVDEATLRAANDLARTTTDIAVDHTGTAGLAGLMQMVADDPDPWRDKRVVVLFTGEDREGQAHG
jgi:threonine synthase